jgi:hypothetical protein
MTVISLSEAASVAQQNIVIDTNFLLYVDGFISYDERTQAYSDSYFDLKKRNKLFISEYAVGEYCNRLSKYYYECDRSCGQTTMTYKNYRKSSDFSLNIETIHDGISSFLTEIEFHNNNDIDIRKSLSEFKTGYIDFSRLSYCSIM